MGAKAVFKILFSRKATAIAAVFILVLILVAVFADVLAPYGLNEQDLRHQKETPSAAHLLGTDNYGRDVLSRLIYGSRISLVVAFVSVVVAGVAGSVIGLIAGYVGGVVDGIIMRLTDALMAFPTIVFALGIAAALGQSTTNLVIAIGVSTIPPYIRTIRGEVMKVRSQTYIKASKVIGASVPRQLFSHILPNCVAPVIVTASVGLGGAIMTEATLSFLGMGIRTPDTSWGVMVSDGFEFITSAPHLAIIPGVAIALVVLAFNFLGDGLRDALDPHVRGTL